LQAAPCATRGQSGRIRQSGQADGMTRIKICGITNLDDARVAVEAGADYLGFILFAKSPRYVEPETVRAILAALGAAGHPVQGIGVFVNHPIDDVARILEATGLTYAQLHG